MKKLILGLVFLLGCLSLFAQEDKTALKARYDFIRAQTAPSSVTRTIIADAYQETSDASHSVFYVSTSGTDTYTATRLGIDTYASKWFVVYFGNANTGASTLDINGIGAISIVKNISDPLVSGDIKAGGAYIVHFDGTNFRIGLGGSTSGFVQDTRLINTTSPITGGGDLSADRTIAINNAAADGSTKGAASFTAADFNATTGNISIDYANGQEATAGQDGFLSSTDWTTFNNKQATGLSWLLASGGTLTGPNTITSNAANGLNWTSTFTAGATNDYFENKTGTLTHDGVAADILKFSRISPTITTNANNQISIGLDIDVTFNGTGTGIKTIGQRIVNGQLLLGTSLFSTSTTSGVHVIKSSATEVSGLIAQNLTGGATALTSVILANSSNSVGAIAFSSAAYTPTSIRATGLALINSGTGGVSIVAGNASGVISLATGGIASTNTRVSINETGQVLFANSGSDVVTASTRTDFRGVSSGTIIRAASSGNTARYVLLDNGIATYDQASQSSTHTFQTFTQAAHTGGSPVGLLFTGGAHTTLTASTEATDINLNLARTVQFATGALATQRAVRIQAPTYAFVGASTITTAATLSISGPPIAGTNATITDSYALMTLTGKSLFNGIVRIGLDGTSFSILQMLGGTSYDEALSYSTSDVLLIGGGSRGRTDINGGAGTTVAPRVQFLSSLVTNGGSGTTTFVNVIPTMNTSGSFSGVVRGIVYNPTETALGGVTANYGLLIGGTGLNGIGTLTPTYKFQVTGTSANESLFLVEENGGTNIFEVAEVSGTNRIGYFATTPAIQQSVNTILVNNVTSGGTVSVISDFTSLTVYATDAATIRDNFFRLTEKVLKLETALRNYGLVID